jgi:hypothetical protein
MAEGFLGQLVLLVESIEAGYFLMSSTRPPMVVSLAHTIMSLADSVINVYVESYSHKLEIQKLESRTSSSSNESYKSSVKDMKGNYNLLSHEDRYQCTKY